MGEILNDICELIVDCEHKTAPTQSDGYPSIRTPNLGRGEFLLDGVNRVSEDTYNAWTRRAIPKEKDIILAREAPIGNAAIIPKNLKVCLGQRTVLIRPNKKKVLPEYLLYLLIGDEIQNRILSISSGATVPHLNMEDIRNLNLPSLPKYSWQEKISSILYNYYKLIEKNTRRIHILEEMAQRIYKEWFVDFKYPGHENDQMVDSELGIIPEGWEVKRLDNFVSFDRGTEPGSKNYLEMWVEGVVPFFRVGDLGSRNKKIFIHINLAINKLLKYDDIVISMDGTVGIVKTGLEGCFSTSIRKCRIIDDYINSPYLFYALKSKNIQSTIKAHATGATILHASSSIKHIKIALCPKNTMESFFELVNPIYLLKKTLKNKNENLRQTRDLLLPKLISGKIDVSDLDIEIGET